ncbi:MAG: hypothetical protein R2749_29880 [Acidimicrobiales bacterium]
MAEPDKHADIEQRRAGALLEVAARALAATGTATSTADRYQVVVRVDADVLTGDNPPGSAMWTAAMPSRRRPLDGCAATA